MTFWRWGKMFVRLSYRALLLVVDMECEEEIARAYRGDNDDVAIE